MQSGFRLKGVECDNTPIFVGCEGNEDAHISRDDSKENSSNFFRPNFDFSKFGFLMFFFKFSSFPLLKGRQTPLSNRKSVRSTKNVIDL